jgi:hypothetical protein
MINECWAVGGIRNGSTWRKLAPEPHYPLQIPQVLTWDSTLATMVGSWRQTASAAIWPQEHILWYKLVSICKHILWFAVNALVFFLMMMPLLPAMNVTIFREWPDNISEFSRGRSIGDTCSTPEDVRIVQIVCATIYNTQSVLRCYYVVSNKT